VAACNIRATSFQAARRKAWDLNHDGTVFTSFSGHDTGSGTSVGVKYAIAANVWRNARVIPLGLD